MDCTIYHNPRCQKSRETLKLLLDKGVDPKVVKYLENPLDASEISNLCDKLGIQATQLLRKSEAVYKEHFKGKILRHDEAVKAIAKYPKLMERPVVVTGNKAVIGRPPENVFKIL